MMLNFVFRFSCESYAIENACLLSATPDADALLVVFDDNVQATEHRAFVTMTTCYL